MRLTDVLRGRIAGHLLGTTKGRDVVEVARRINGLHAQVASSAQAAATLRLGEAPDLDRALFQDKTLVRTWAARGTLHLLPADDLPLWVAAMSTRTRETTPSWLRYNGVTAEQMQDIHAALPDVLGATPLTREELAGAIIDATGHEHLREKLVHGFGSILKPPAFKGLLCSGPPRGRNVTFVAPQKWLGPFRVPPAEEGIDALALAYLGAYGPATPEAFARWFDLKPPLAKKAFARLPLRPAGDFGFLPADLPPVEPEDTVLLLPAFDPYVVGSTGQLDLVSTGPKEAVSRPQGWISPTLVVNGRIEGVWEPSPDGPRVKPFGAVSAVTKRALPENAAIV